MAGNVCGISIIFLITWIVLVHESDGHPQCLDSRPPFNAHANLLFCKDYEQFGCCTPQNDMELKNKFLRIGNLIPAKEKSLWRKCSDYAKTFLCQTCSPYAAHIFDSEKTQTSNAYKPRAFPALCGSFCSEFYKSCKDLVKYYMDVAGSEYIEERTRLNMKVNQNETAFCSNISITDVDYCFPELLSNPILTGNISIEKVTKEGCICVKPYDKVQFRNPIFLKHVKDGSDRLFIGEQLGLVHIMYINETILPEPFLDIRMDVKTTSRKGDERGMLGMEFHPDYTSNGKLYIYYSTELNGTEKLQGKGNHKIRIEEFMVDPFNPNKVDIYGYSRVILEVYQPYWNHNGGEILFGDDGYLYLFVGDGGYLGDPLQSGQDLFSMLGKVLRIDVDYIDKKRQKEYSIPQDNPFADGVHGLPEIYAYGVRNIWRCGKDRGDPVTKHGKGRIVCGDVGQGAVEEVDLIEKGANYGWNLKEGTADYCTDCRRANTKVNFTDPIAEYTHNVGKSVTGGHFYRGCESPNLNGFYIYGDFMSGKLFRLKGPSNPKKKKWHHKELNMCASDWCVPPLTNDYATSIISFGEDEYGEVYMLSTSFASTASFAGTVYKIVDPMRRGHPEVCKSKRNPTSTGTSTKTKGTTTPTVIAGTTVSDAVPQYTGSSGDGRMMNYLDYFKRQELRNRRRKMQKQFKKEREEKKKNLSVYRGTPPPQIQPGLIFHGINIHRCTNTPTFWCSLSRLIPSPRSKIESQYSQYSLTTKMNFLLLLCLKLLILYVSKVTGQQCLDLMPPFTPAAPLRFCEQYSKYGCCTSHDDERLGEINEDIRYMVRQGEDRQINPSCLQYAKAFLCARCSPFSAEIFRNKVTYNLQMPRIFPGLCNNFCTRFYDNCNNILPEFLVVLGNTEEKRERAKFLDSLTITSNPAEFCEEVGLPPHRTQYCHPVVDSTFGESSRLTTDKVTTAECVCLQSYDISLRNPVAIANANDGTGRLFIAEQTGVVKIMFSDGRISRHHFLDIQSKVYQNNDGFSQLGLLGLTFHPEFKNNHKLYVFYTFKKNNTSDLHIRVEEYRVKDTDDDRVDSSSNRVIIEVQKDTINHAGGSLLFGKDGYLYIFIGDDGGDGDAMEFSQDLFMFHGKVLRVNVDVTDFVAGKEYSIPNDNPFAGKEELGLPEIYAWGLRNPWKCSVDRAKFSERIFCGDVGVETYEEVNIVKKKANYGWNIKEGTSNFCPDCLRGLPEVNITDPIFQYRHTIGVAVVGGNIYRGCLNPNLHGQYIFGDFQNGLFRLEENTRKQMWSGERLEICPASRCLGSLGSQIQQNILAFGEDEDGEIYVLTTSSPSFSSPTGRVYKIVDPIRRGNPKHCKASRSADGKSAVTGDVLPPVIPDPNKEETPPTTTQAPTTTTPRRQQRPVPETPRRNRAPQNTGTQRRGNQRPRSRFNFLRRLFSRRRGNTENEENRNGAVNQSPARNSVANNRRTGTRRNSGSRNTQQNSGVRVLGGTARVITLRK
ncbi:uncharacterized protein LOC123564080 [Mercenaria mercenaria]|uniref:uncharacterized protein LOC123564080 n=1 Tax=Mercenaria mercenaria TaxID=6596 RepID=UPI00234F0F15|nr:uncharacterized protein LOC123564080 [Mercenaria mercenaria]